MSSNGVTLAEINYRIGGAEGDTPALYEWKRRLSAHTVRLKDAEFLGVEEDQLVFIYRGRQLRLSVRKFLDCVGQDIRQRINAHGPDALVGFIYNLRQPAHAFSSIGLDVPIQFMKSKIEEIEKLKIE